MNIDFLHDSLRHYFAAGALHEEYSRAMLERVFNSNSLLSRDLLGTIEFFVQVRANHATEQDFITPVAEIMSETNKKRIRENDESKIPSDVVDWVESLVYQELESHAFNLENLGNAIVSSCMDETLYFSTRERLLHVLSIVFRKQPAKLVPLFQQILEKPVLHHWLLHGIGSVLAYSLREIEIFVRRDAWHLTLQALRRLLTARELIFEGNAELVEHTKKHEWWRIMSHATQTILGAMYPLTLEELYKVIQESLAIDPGSLPVSPSLINLLQELDEASLDASRKDEAIRSALSTDSSGDSQTVLFYTKDPFPQQLDEDLIAELYGLVQEVLVAHNMFGSLTQVLLQLAQVLIQLDDSSIDELRTIVQEEILRPVALASEDFGMIMIIPNLHSRLKWWSEAPITLVREAVQAKLYRDIQQALLTDDITGLQMQLSFVLHKIGSASAEGTQGTIRTNLHDAVEDALCSLAYTEILHALFYLTWKMSMHSSDNRLRQSMATIMETIRRIRPSYEPSRNVPPLFTLATPYSQYSQLDVAHLIRSTRGTLERRRQKVERPELAAEVLNLAILLGEALENPEQLGITFQTRSPW